MCIYILKKILRVYSLYLFWGFVSYPSKMIASLWQYDKIRYTENGQSICGWGLKWLDVDPVIWEYYVGVDVVTDKIGSRRIEMQNIPTIVLLIWVNRREESYHSYCSGTWFNHVHMYRITEVSVLYIREVGLDTWNKLQYKSNRVYNHIRFFTGWRKRNINYPLFHEIIFSWHSPSSPARARRQYHNHRFLVLNSST